MTNQVGTSGVSREELARHFDGELTGAEAHELAAQIDADPELREELAQLGLMQGLLQHSLRAKAAEVPQARFEQMWDEIDRQLDLERAGAKAATPSEASIWSRLWAAVRPARIPLAAAAAAAAVTIAVMSFTGEPEAVDQSVDGANNGGPVASVHTPAIDPPEQTPKPPQSDDRVAVAPAPEPATDLPKPKKVEAEIHGVEFSGHTGRISKTGTVTVLYLEEEPQPKDTERSL